MTTPNDNEVRTCGSCGNIPCTSTKACICWTPKPIKVECAEGQGDHGFTADMFEEHKKPTAQDIFDATGYEHSWHLIYETCLKLGMSFHSEVAISGEQLVCKFIRGLADKVNGKPSDYRMPFPCQKEYCDIFNTIKGEKIAKEVASNMSNMSIETGSPEYYDRLSTIKTFCAAVLAKVGERIRTGTDELTALERVLPAMIDKEQDDVANGYLVDIHDALEGYRKAKRVQGERGFANNPA